MSRRLLAALLAATALTASACDDSESPTDPVLPDGPAYDSLTVDASSDWAFVSFQGGEARSVTVSDPASSEAWNVAFYATSVMLNGGAAGPGALQGHCLCQNASVSDETLVGLTPESELSLFEGVSGTDVPTDEDAWQSDVLAAAIDGWWSYDVQTHTVSAAPDAVWAVRSASGDAYAKVHVTGVADATQEHAGRVTFEYALQPTAGAAFEPPVTATVDLSGGDVHWDLETGSEVGAGDGWDLLFQGYDIRVNGGVSGDGDAGAVVLGESFEAVTDASDAPAQVYAADAFGGVFEADPWYRYNVQGGHQIWPTFNVYLLDTGDAVYKVQLTGYYGPSGDSRQISFRYEPLS